MKTGPLVGVGKSRPMEIKPMSKLELLKLLEQLRVHIFRAKHAGANMVTLELSILETLVAELQKTIEDVTPIPNGEES